jgi:hypothetical protein
MARHMSDIAAASGIRAAEIGAKINYAVAGKVLQSQRQEGAAVLGLLESATGKGSGETGLGGDRLLAAATGLGGSLDVTA